MNIVCHVVLVSQAMCVGFRKICVSQTKIARVCVSVSMGPVRSVWTPKHIHM